MNLRTCLVVLGMVLGIAVVAPQAFAAKGVKKNTTAEHRIHGTVIHVEHKGPQHGEITVKTHHHKKKGQPAVAGVKAGPGHEHKFTVGPNTRFLVVHGQNATAATFAAVHKGEQVEILVRGHHAETVTIHHHHTVKTGVKKVAKK
jgi:hypothetical protein